MSTPDVREPDASGALAATAVPDARAATDATAVPDVTAVPPARGPSDLRPSASQVLESPHAAGAAHPAEPAAALAFTADLGRAQAGTVTLYDVARLAGVSTATVSRVVHGQDRVRDSTRARVRDIIDQLGYVPDGAAQSLSRRQKNVIGLVGVERMAPHQYDIESMSLLFYDEILRGVEARIRDHNWSLLITYLREESN